MKETNALATYLVALALLQNTGKTHVNHEIMDVIEILKRELRMDK
ncbi:hypothetical protein [Halobacillus naozhouensis]|uniref:Uncharacterized protein n=1 Tax=Halobacillus naozhouensis TaxID=554880 RepID=A0ABY8J2A1_9BACI|nr:hypothetical protein [Halobacillus naozhouensis]WFT74885.1 hypothetical protein P9989_00145 [Halobacillus naozhouensis]